MSKRASRFIASTGYGPEPVCPSCSSVLYSGQGLFTCSDCGWTGVTDGKRINEAVVQ